MSQGWPAGTYAYPYDELPKVLFDGSAMHARVAVSLHSSDGGWDAQRLAISIGTAAELLLKHALTMESFHLLPDKGFSVDTALSLAGRAKARDGLPKLTTVAGPAALQRVDQVFTLRLKREDFDPIFQVRNTALHLGVASTKVNTEAFKQLVILTEVLFEHLNTDARTRTWYWGGEEAEHFVKVIIDDAATEAQSAYEALIHRARVAYRRLTLSLVDADRSDVIHQFAEVTPTFDEETEVALSHQCPACKNMGWVVYQVERGWPTVEYPDDDFNHHRKIPYVDREGIADRFECGVCRLKLDHSIYLDSAGVDMRIDLESDDATEAEVDAAEEAAIDNYISSQIDELRGK
ncbi:hypothetical protein ABLE94_02495 [Gordonia sp. VNK1]|uniref:hypothetical protein n=1 Tax=Gordonia oleivorans TaxID=3156618 RepID=UPI0032B3B01D